MESWLRHLQADLAVILIANNQLLQSGAKPRPLYASPLTTAACQLKSC
jgi:hypothetical protein